MPNLVFLWFAGSADLVPCGDYYYRGKMSADEDQWWMERIKATARDTAGEVLCEELSPKWRRDLRDFMNLFFSREDTQGRLGQARRDWDTAMRSKKQDWSAALQEVQVIKKRLDSFPVWSHATEELFKHTEQNFNHLFQEMKTVKEQVGDISSPSTAVLAASQPYPLSEGWPSQNLPMAPAKAHRDTHQEGGS